MPLANDQLASKTTRRGLRVLMLLSEEIDEKDFHSSQSPMQIVFESGKRRTSLLRIDEVKNALFALLLLVPVYNSQHAFLK